MLNKTKNGVLLTRITYTVNQTARPQVANVTVAERGGVCVLFFLVTRDGATNVTARVVKSVASTRVVTAFEATTPAV